MWSMISHWVWRALLCFYIALSFLWVRILKLHQDVQAMLHQKFFCVCKLHVQIAIYRYQIAFVFHSRLRFHHAAFLVNPFRKGLGLRDKLIAITSKCHRPLTAEWAVVWPLWLEEPRPAVYEIFRLQFFPTCSIQLLHPGKQECMCHVGNWKNFWGIWPTQERKLEDNQHWEFPQGNGPARSLLMKTIPIFRVSREPFSVTFLSTSR